MERIVFFHAYLKKMNGQMIFLILLVIFAIISIVLIMNERNIRQLWDRTIGRITKVVCGHEFTARECHRSSSTDSVSHNHKHTHTYTYCRPIFQKNCSIDIEYAVDGGTYTTENFKTYRRHRYPEVDDIHQVYYKKSDPNISQLHNPSLAGLIVICVIMSVVSLLGTIVSAV